MAIYWYYCKWQPLCWLRVSKEMCDCVVDQKWFLLRGINMRPGCTQTGMSLYRLPCISSRAFTQALPDKDLRLVWLYLSCWTETRNSFTGPSSYLSYVNDNKSQTRARNFKPVWFLVSYIFIWQNMSFCPKTRQQAFPPWFHINLLQKFDTSSSISLIWFPNFCRLPPKLNLRGQRKFCFNLWLLGILKLVETELCPEINMGLHVL